MTATATSLVPYGKSASVVARVKLLLVLLLGGLSGVKHGIIWLLFRSSRRQMSFKMTMFAAASRTLLHYMSADDLQVSVGLKALETELKTPLYWNLAKTHLNFNQPLKAEKLVHSTKLSPNLAAPKTQWIHEVENRKPDDPVLYFLHGGGFALSVTVAQIYWMRDLLKKLPSKRLSICVLNYSLSPYAKYPTQLHETFYGYEALTQSCNRIITIGDSAGGALSGALALTLTKYPELQKHLYGQIYVSPWAELVPENTGSVVNNVDHDWIAVMFGARCAGWYAGRVVDPVTRDFTEPITDECQDLKVATAERLREAIPKRTVCVWSTGEILADACQRFAVKAGIKNTLAEAGTVHDILYFGHNNLSSKFILEHLTSWL